MRRRVVWLAVIGAVLVYGELSRPASAAQPVAYITEIHRPGASEVGIKRAGQPDWRSPQPLLPLEPGDQVRVSGDARVVLLYHAGGGTQTVVASNSPFTVTPASGASSGEQFRVLATGITEYLFGKREAPTYKRAATRSLGAILISPRHTRLFPGDVVFEWEGSDALTYTVRVLGPEGLLWEQRNLPRRPVKYPATAAPLRLGVRYFWELEAPGQPVERTQFEILTETDTARIRNALGVVEKGTREGYPRSTVTVIRAALLSEEGLFTDARRELEAAVVTNHDEPTLSLLLGHVYDQIGLTGKAADAFERARGRP